MPIPIPIPIQTTTRQVQVIAAVALFVAMFGIFNLSFKFKHCMDGYTPEDNIAEALPKIEHASALLLTSTPSISPNKTRHCAFVVSNLYGTTHSTNRINATINWYKQVTLESIRLAARYSSDDFEYIGAFVGVDGLYATEPALSLLQLGGDVGIPIHADIKKNLDQLVTLILQEKSCDVASMVRIDADDMLSPHALENIRWAWKNNRCNSSEECAQVVGTMKNKRMTIAPLTDKGQLKCLFSSKNNPDFVSAGVSVTLPIQIFRHFDKKIQFSLGSHKNLYNNIRKKMKELGLQADMYQIFDHSVLTLTPISSHYNIADPDAMNGPLRNCTLIYLETELGQDLGNIIWKARDAIPTLSKKEWKQNRYISDNGGEVKKYRPNDEKWELMMKKKYRPNEEVE
mmetsp:Transcript_52312/g.60400  ORF Transcript_52312/g.60400 Transcript_52312/m.60400 type:complete len:400 (+) Transcript_52312:165-1364(+)